MVRKWASLAIGLVLIVALSFTLAHIQPEKIDPAYNGFSAPCDPASSVLKSASEATALFTIHSTSLADVVEGPVICTRSSCVDAPPQVLRVAAPRAFPPLLHRPPPANS